MNYDNLIFLHIPKAAGSTLHPVLERHYPKRATRTLLVPGQLEIFTQLPVEARQRIRLLKGHMPFGMHDYLAGRSRYVTLLRHPAERIVSHYYYVKRRPDHYLHHHIAAGMKLADFVSAGISGELDNGQVRLLAGHDQDIPFGHCTRDIFEIAQRNIETHFAVAGLTEHFDESLILMRVALNWSWMPYYVNRNVTEGKPVAKQIDPSTLQVIQQTNALDIELYDWVKQRFQAEIARHRSEVSTGLARLKRANDLYRPWGTLKETIKRNLKAYLSARASATE